MVNKRVLIIGSFGFGNIGDESILYGMLADLRAHCEGVEFHVVTGEPQATQKIHHLETVYWKDIHGILKAVQECDLIILGGGGLFYDYWGFNPNAVLTINHAELSYYVGFPFLATLMDKPLMIYGVGVAQLISEISQDYTKAAFQQAATATVRDQASKEFLVTYGLAAKQVKVTSDPALSMKSISKKRGRTLLNEMLTGEGEFQKPYLGVVLRNWDIGVSQAYWEGEVAAALDRLLEIYGGTVIFFPFQSVEGILTDDRIVEENVKNRMRHHARTTVSPLQYSPPEVAGLIANLDLMIGMRMHSILFAAKARVPFIGLSYDPKVSSFIEQLGCGEYAVHLGSLDQESLFIQASAALESQEEIRDQLSKSVPKLEKLAQKNAGYAAKLLEKGKGESISVPQHAERILRDLQIRQARRIFELQNAVEALSKERDQGSKTIDALEQELAQTQSSMQGLQDQLGSLEEARESLQAKVRSLEGQRESFQARVRSLEEQRESFQALLEKRENDWKSLREEMQNLRAEHESLVASREQVKEAKDELERALEEIRSTNRELADSREYYQALSDTRLENYQSAELHANSLNQQLGALKQDHERVQGILDEILSSRAWRLTRLLWRVRTFLAPHGSRRERLLLFLLRGFRSDKGEASPDFNKRVKRMLGELYQTASQSETLRRTSKMVPEVVKSSARSAYQEAKKLSPEGFGEALEDAQRAQAAPAPSSAVEEEPHPSSDGSKVAFLTNQLLDWETREPRYGGGERYCITLGELLHEMGFQVTFFQAGREAFESEYYGFKVVSLELGASYSEFQYGVCNKFYARTKDYDHIVLNLPEYASGKVRPDSLLICHGIWFDHANYGPPIAFRTAEWFQHLYRAFSQPAHVISNDTNSINVIRSLWPPLAERMSFIPNWVDVEEFKPNFNRGKNNRIVLFPRRSQINRGSRILCDILKDIPHDWRFLWVGKGDVPDNQIIEGLAQEDPRLDFLSASFEEMPGYYHQSEICVIPTIACEGTSLACLEALASGCAVVATHVGGLSNLIFPGVNGLMVDPTARSIAEAVNFLIENPDERARLQVAAVQSAKSFALERWKDHWRSLLSELNWTPPDNKEQSH